jgi:hypothetical protein
LKAACKVTIGGFFAPKKDGHDEKEICEQCCIKDFHNLYAAQCDFSEVKYHNTKPFRTPEIIGTH